MKTKWMVMLGLGAALGLCLPDLAMAAYGAAPWESALQTVVDYMTGSTARLISTLAVAGVGVVMLAGHVSIRTFIMVILGIAILFGSASVVGIFAR